MTTHAKTFLLLFILSVSVSSYSQSDKRIDSLKKVAATATTAEAKIQAIDVLSKLLMNVNLEEADKYGKQMIVVAEESRDRKLMINAYLSNGTRCSYLIGRKEYLDRSIDCYNKALAIAIKTSTRIKLALLICVYRECICPRWIKKML